uniref:Uncharacterized protein n=2 Tax=environmental samples TaxID=68359 RepID=A0A075GT12_9EURY|nr:hypothetical protein [uncultured marine group II/III euryarchaeote KM3_196_G04]AIF13032.1 hypothetical protein [uncultured marine group II/III euryarchaeote KM3_59_C08]
MAGLGKAARGKRRWIGLRVPCGAASRASCEGLLEAVLEGLQWRMYDHNSGPDGSATAIVMVPLSDCESATSRINSEEGWHTLTRSGKIRLVRKRLELD